MSGQRVLHVADLNNEGSSPRDLWVPQIKKARGSITDILFYVDRLEDGVKEMDKLGINRHAVVPLDNNAWQFLLDSEKIDLATYTSMNERLEDKRAWAHKMLRDNIGRLREILEKPSTTEKGLKIMDIGYPEIKDELVDRLRDVGYRRDIE